MAAPAATKLVSANVGPAAIHACKRRHRKRAKPTAWGATLPWRARLDEIDFARPRGRVQPAEMPNARSPINTTVVETKLQQPAAAKAIASAKK